MFNFFLLNFPVENKNVTLIDILLTKINLCNSTFKIKGKRASTKVHILIIIYKVVQLIFQVFHL